MKINSTGSIIELNATDIDKTFPGLYYIQSISWVSDQGTGLDIAENDDFLLYDAHDFRIASKRAEAVGDDFGKSFAKAVPVDGLKLKALDGGVCTLYLNVNI